MKETIPGRDWILMVMIVAVMVRENVSFSSGHVNIYSNVSSKDANMFMKDEYGIVLAWLMYNCGTEIPIIGPIMLEN